MLTSLQNPLIKQIKKLHRAKERREQQLFLLEGTHLIEEATTVGISLDTVCLTEAWQERHADLLSRIQAQRIEIVSPEIVSAIATTVQPDGIVATAPRHHTENFSFNQLGLALETIQDPGNLGTIIRTAAAAGVDGLWLSQDSVDLDHPKVLRASAGQWFRLPMAVLDLETAIRHHHAGIQVIATVPTAQKTYWDIDFSRPSIVLMGNEGAGLSDQLMALADEQVTIPLSPGVESLNVAIATALILYEAKRQQT
jgi:RNA methyltransferase, TrmH family